MTKAIRVLSVVILATGTVSAQPTSPEPELTPAAAPAPQHKDEKAGSDESLEKGGDNRPWAAGVSVEKQKQALLQFREGNTLLNDGLFARASETYRKALESWNHPAIHYNMALALMNLDQPVEAYESLKKAIAYGDPPLQSKDKFDHAREYMLLLEKQLATIEVSCDKPGAKVSVNGKEVFVAPGTYKSRVRIGRHTFVADKKGYQTRINAPFIGPGENFRIELKLYTAEELTRYTRRWNPWVPYSVLAGGAAIGLVGVVFELSAGASYNDYDKQVAICNMSNQGCPTTPELTSLRDSGDTKKLIGYVSYGVAGGALATGILIAILNRPKAYQIRPEDLQEEQDTKQVTVTPIVTPTMAGAMVHGQF